VLVRADNLGHLTSSGQQALVAYGIRTIIDVRSAEECVIWPHAFSQHDTITTINIPIGTGATPEAQTALDDASDLTVWNCLALEHCQMQIGQILQRVAQAEPGGVLIHCHAGKDRTGLAIALLLALADVDSVQIAADYAASEGGLQPLFAAWLAEVVDNPVRHAALASHLNAHPATMLAVLAHIDAEYGGVTAYLQECGVSRSDQIAVRYRLRGV
jgi:protein-tyrosine phosphatase